MPWQKDGKRDYKREYALYQGTPLQRARRSARTTLRNKANKEGITHKGDGKDLDHKNPLSKGGANTLENTRVVSKAKNRSFSRNPNGSLKSQTSKREKK